MLKNRETNGYSLPKAVLVGFATLLAVGNAEAAVDGVYLGGQGGVVLVNSETTTTGGTTDAFDGNGAKGLTGGLLLGYGQRVDASHFAVEVEGGASSADYQERKGNGDAYDMEMDYNYGISFLGGGYLTHSTLLYGRIGWMRANFDWKRTSGGVTRSGSADTHGFRGGLGLQTDLSAQLSLRGEYLYTNYSEYNFGTGNETFSVTPASGTFRLGVIYDFPGL